MCSTFYGCHLYQFCFWRATNTDKNLHLRIDTKITVLNEKAEVLSNVVEESRLLGCDTVLWATSYICAKEPHCLQKVGNYLPNNKHFSSSQYKQVDFLLLCFRAQGLHESAPADSVFSSSSSSSFFFFFFFHWHYSPLWALAC
jgi:hypothetical protein